MPLRRHHGHLPGREHDYGDIVDAEARPVGPIRPSAILKEEFLAPRAISAGTALRLGRYFGTSAEFWLGLQIVYDLEMARLDMGSRLEQEIVPCAA